MAGVKDAVDKEIIYSFLKKIDDDFSPKLSSKVNLLEYVDKIISCSKLLIDCKDEVLRGLVVLYCNNTNERIAYIPLVGVDSLYRGRGIAKNLLLEAIDISKSNGMKCVQVHSNNPIAIKMYQNIGFQIVSGDNRKLLEFYI